MSTATLSDPLPEDPVALQALVRSQHERIAELEQRLAWFLVQYQLAQHRRFAASTETGIHQLDLFSELLAEILPEDIATAPAAPVNAEDEGGPAARGVTAGGVPCQHRCPGKPSGTTTRTTRRRVRAVGNPAS